MILPYPKNGRWGFVDEHGLWQIKPIYSSANAFCEELAIVGDENGKIGAINKRGCMRVPFIYEELESFWGGFSVGHRFGLPECENEILSCSGISVMIEDSKWLDNLGNGLFAVRKHSSAGFSIVDYRGKAVNSVVYTELHGIVSSLGLVHCKRENTYRVEDKQGRVVRLYDVDRMQEFWNGRAIACKGGKWGIIDIFGKIILPMEFKCIQRIDNAMDRFVLVELFDKDEGLFHLYDMRTGSISAWTVDAMIYVTICCKDIYWVLQNDMWSIMNDKFETIMPNLVFSMVTINGEKLVRMESKNGFRYYVADKNGYKCLF